MVAVLQGGYVLAPAAGERAPVDRAVAGAIPPPASVDSSRTLMHIVETRHAANTPGPAHWFTGRAWLEQIADRIAAVASAHQAGVLEAPARAQPGTRIRSVRRSRSSRASPGCNAT